VFFPTGDPTCRCSSRSAAFGLAYLVRPLGAIVVGGYTDRAGRKAGLLLSMALMMIGTTLMAVTPGYATIGLAAPIIITLARLLQGFRSAASSAAPSPSWPSMAAGAAGSAPAGNLPRRHHHGSRLAVRGHPHVLVEP